MLHRRKFIVSMGKTQRTTRKLRELQQRFEMVEVYSKTRGEGVWGKIFPQRFKLLWDNEWSKHF